MSSPEFTEWLAFYQLEPFGPWRDDVRIGVLGASLAPMLGDFKGKRVTVEDFMPRFHESVQPQQRQTPEEMQRRLMHIVQAYGGAVTHG